MASNRRRHGEERSGEAIHAAGLLRLVDRFASLAMTDRSDLAALGRKERAHA